jgi:hypothetical protein
MKKILLLISFLICSFEILSMDKAVLEKSFDTFQKNPSMKLVLYFHGFGQFDTSSSIFYGKSGPAFAEDIIEDVKIYQNYVHIKYTNRGKGEYFNDIYISIPHITLVHSTKSSIEIYVGNPKVIGTGK